MRKTLKSSMVSYDKFCSMLEQLIFNYENMPEVEKLSAYDALLDSAEDVDIDMEKELPNLPDGDTSPEMESHYGEIILFGTELAIENYFVNKTIKDNFCLKINVKGVAVQMKYNDDMLGFISDLTDNPRFVMVDFGDVDGAVKIDLDELIVG